MCRFKFAEFAYIFPLHSTETELAGRMKEGVPGVTSVTPIPHLNLMVLQCFRTRERLTAE
jgi:hypothetical protein